MTDVALLLAIATALVFALTNGFNDAANAIATLVATRVARPLPAVIMAGLFNLLGPLLLGAAVADTIAKLVTVAPESAVAVIGAGLTGATLWNVYTWRNGLPSSSSHALVGGLVGAALLDSGLAAVNWGPVVDGHLAGVLGVLVGLLLATVLGFGVAFAVQRLALAMLSSASTRWARPIRGAQWVTSAGLAFSHGANDAQKTVGIIAALLVASGSIPTLSDVGVPVVIACAFALTLGTALGGWRIVKTIGSRIYRLRTVDGLVSQLSSGGIILAASLVGAPVSTTQVVSSSVVGIGTARGRWRHVSWGIVRDIGIAWATTMPAAAMLAALSLPLWRSIPGG